MFRSVLIMIGIACVTVALGCSDYSFPAGYELLITENHGGTNRHDIYLLDSDSKRKLTDSPGSDFSPSFSPDGELIVFASERDKLDQSNIFNSDSGRIYVMNSDGSNQRPVTPLEESVCCPTFLPDGRIVFLSSGPFARPHYSKLAKIAMNTDGTDRQFFNLPYSSPEWTFSKDGKEAYFRHTGPDLLPQIYVDGQQLTFMRGGAYFARFSSDGDLIVFAGSDDRGGHGIYIMKSDGSNQRFLTSTESGGERHPHLSDDGALIAFSSSSAGDEAEIYLMNSDGTDRRAIIKSDNPIPWGFRPVR